MGRTRVVWNVTNNRLENANGRLKDRVHHFGTLEHAIQKVSRHAEWFMREVGMQISQFQTVRTILLRFFSLLPNPPTTDIALQLTGKGVPLTLVHNTPPTALDGLRKQMNRVVHKLWGLEPRRATPTFKQLIARGQILLRQGSKSATDVLPSVVEDNAPESRWRSRDTDFGFCVLCERPITTSDCWGATDRVLYLADYGDSEPCPLCGNDLRPVPKVCLVPGLKRGRLMILTWTEAQDTSTMCPGSLRVSAFPGPGPATKNANDCTENKCNFK
ncbi:hypothetical protein CSKR_105219 [Clonorchis sinensis]|uniref:Uncharacterized protein n=1 Tax=Clonorchis sinensis TaxID=79923 RepID=A0A419PD19_CLOSI|nr:hypothetical protein CSKR_105219 [Clonorchis sinensis]